MNKNPLTALRKVFASGKLLFICILFTLGALANLYGAVSDSPDLTTLEIVGIEIDLVELLGDEIGEVLESITTFLLVMSIIAVLPQLLCAAALWLVRSGKEDNDGAAKRACIGLSFIKLQSLLKIVTVVAYLIGVCIFAVLALTASSHIDSSGKATGIVLGASAVVILYFVIVISYHSKLMTMMITVSNTLRTGKNQVRRFALVTVLNWFFAAYYVISGFSGEVEDILAGFFIGAVYIFMNFLFSDYRDDCGWADIEVTKAYMKALATDPARRETAEALGFENVTTPGGVVFAPSIKGIVRQQFFGISLSPTRRQEAEGTLREGAPIKTTAFAQMGATRADFSAAEPYSPDVLRLFDKEGAQERFVNENYDVSLDGATDGRLSVTAARVMRDTISDSLLLNLALRSEYPIAASGIRARIAVESIDGAAAGLAERVEIRSGSAEADKSAEEGGTSTEACELISEYGITLPKNADKITVTVSSLLFADGLAKDGLSIEFTLLSPAYKEAALLAEEAEQEANKKRLDGYSAEYDLLSRELSGIRAGENASLVVALGFVDPFTKNASKADELCNELARFCGRDLRENIRREAESLIGKVRTLKDSYLAKQTSYAPERKKRLAVSISCCSAMVAILFCILIPAVIIPAMRLKIARDMREDGMLIEAYYELKSIDRASAQLEREELKSEIEYFTLPTFVTKIDPNEFAGFDNIKSVTLHSGVEEVGFGAFAGCDNITDITLHKAEISVRYLFGYNNNDSIDGELAPSLVRLTYLGGENLASYAVADCRSLKYVTLPSGLKTLGDRAFGNCVSLEYISLPDGLTDVSSAFYGCTALKELIIPKSVTHGYYEMLDYCTSLEKLTIPEIHYGNLGNEDVFVLPSMKGSTSKLKSVTVSRASIIGTDAFENLDKLEEVFLPEGVTSIGNRAFLGCSSLKSLVIPSSVKSIGSQAFNYTDIKTIVIDPVKWAQIDFQSTESWGWSGNDTTYIDASTFTPLTELVLPEGATEIGKAAFRGCKTLKSVRLPSTVKTINEYAFLDCTALESLELNEGLESVGRLAFNGCTSLTSLITPSTLSVIGSNAFSDCTALSEVSFKPGLGKVENDAFSNTLIKVLTFPDSVTEVGSMSDLPMLYKITFGSSVSNKEAVSAPYYLHNCPSLCEIYDRSAVKVAENIANNYSLPLNYYTDTEGESRLVNQNGLLFFDGANGEAYLMTYLGENEILVLPDDFDGKEYSVWKSAFAYNEALRSITFSKGVKEIYEKVIAFSENVSELIVDDNNPYFYSKNNCIIQEFYDTKTLTVGCKTSIMPSGSEIDYIDSYAFYGCLGLTSVTVPNNVTVWYYVFAECRNLSTAYVEGNVPYGVFENCTSLVEVTVGSGATKISDYAFNGCRSLRRVSIPRTVSSIGSYAFGNCSSLETISLPAELTELGSFAFSHCSSLLNITLPAKLGTLRASVFYDCTKLRAVSLPDGLKKIDSYAFYGCSSIESLTLPASLEKIEKHAFVGCRSLTSLALPESLYEIGDGAFDSCEKLLFYDYYGCAYIGNWLIDVNIKEGMSGDITVKAGTVGIAGGAFSPNGTYDIVTSITLPAGLKYISSEAFSYCKEITTIEIPDSVIYLGENLFLGCENDVEIIIPDGVPSNSQSPSEEN